MAYLLDTNTCIGWLRNSEPRIVSRIKQESPVDLLLCSIVVGELIYGAERSGPLYRASRGDRMASRKTMLKGFIARRQRNDDPLGDTATGVNKIPLAGLSIKRNRDQNRRRNERKYR